VNDQQRWLRTAKQDISRRSALKLTGLGLGGLSLSHHLLKKPQVEFPQGDHLGRVCVGRTEIYSRPSGESSTVATLYEDAVVEWQHELVGEAYNIYASNRRWAETPDGYIWAPHLQPVRNVPNAPVGGLEQTSLGQGMWVEVTVPFVDIFLANPPARSPWLKDATLPRLYYSQILWVDEITTDEAGQVWYRINERFGYGDIFYCAAEAFRPLTEEDISPINPEAEEKKVVINLTNQTMACYEGQQEVYYCRISSGAKFNAAGEPVEEWATPIGPHPIWRKVTSLHMSGGTTGGGYDLPGIGWTSLFSGDGVAIHSTFWHNNYGVPMSHGCVNAQPADAQWVFRWTSPVVPYDPGDVTIGMPGGTTVEVIEM
jgi:hypothetical protein